MYVIRLWEVSLCESSLYSVHNDLLVTSYGIRATHCLLLEKLRKLLHLEYKERGSWSDLVAGKLIN